VQGVRCAVTILERLVEGEVVSELELEEPLPLELGAHLQLQRPGEPAFPGIVIALLEEGARGRTAAAPR
jgi:hypothetical protein